MEDVKASQKIGAQMLSFNRRSKIVIAVGLVVFCIVVFRYFKIAPTDNSDNDIISGFIEWFGSLF